MYILEVQYLEYYITILIILLFLLTKYQLKKFEIIITHNMLYNLDNK